MPDGFKEKRVRIASKLSQLVTHWKPTRSRSRWTLAGCGHWFLSPNYSCWETTRFQIPSGWL